MTNMGNTIASCLCSKTRPISIDQSDQIFPNEVIIEILSRLPLKSLTRCQLVCKDWQSLIHNHHFTQMHMAHTDTVHPYEHGCNGCLERSVEVVSVDLESEEVTVNRLPGVDQLGDWKNYWDVDWDGKLGIVDVVGKNMEVLELEDYRKGKWSEKKKIISLGSFLKGDEKVYPLLVMKGEIWLWLNDKEMIVTYTIATGEPTERKKSITFDVCSKLYPYKPSLIRFKGMVPDKKLEDYRPRFLSS